jgi:hypothetical protein
MADKMSHVLADAHKSNAPFALLQSLEGEGFRMKWNQVFGGIFIGLGLGLFLGGAIVDQTQKWNSTSAAGVCSMLMLAGVLAARRDRFKKQPEKPGPNQ